MPLLRPLVPWSCFSHYFCMHRKTLCMLKWSSLSDCYNSFISLLACVCVWLFMRAEAWSWGLASSLKEGFLAKSGASQSASGTPDFVSWVLGLLATARAGQLLGGSGIQTLAPMFARQAFVHWASPQPPTIVVPSKNWRLEYWLDGTKNMSINIFRQSHGGRWTI